MPRTRGIAYLIMQDIAPRAHNEKDRAAALGAIAGFTLGMAGVMPIR